MKTVLIEVRSVDRVAEIMKNSDAPLILCDEFGYDFCAKELSGRLDCNTSIFHSDSEIIADEFAVNSVKNDISLNKYRYLIGVGAASIINICKYAALLFGLNCTVIPTDLSYEKCAEPLSEIIKNGRKKTVAARAPEYVIFNAEKFSC